MEKNDQVQRRIQSTVKQYKMECFTKSANGLNSTYFLKNRPVYAFFPWEVISDIWTYLSIIPSSGENWQKMEEAQYFCLLSILVWNLFVKTDFSSFQNSLIILAFSLSTLVFSIVYAVAVLFQLINIKMLIAKL